MAKVVFRDPLTPYTSIEHTISEYLFSQETEFQQIDFFRTPEFGTVLALGGVVNVTERDEVGYHEMIAHVPMFAHPAPKRVLIIGGGDGGTLREVTRHPGLEEAVLVEIDEVVVEKSKEFLPVTACGFDHPKSRTIIGDGLAYVRDAEAASFDVILVDSTDPVDAGVELFTPAFYRDCHRVLRPNGILVPQSDSVLYYPERVAGIARNLREIFASVDFYTTHVPTYPGGLWTFAFASKGPHPFAHVDALRVQSMVAELDYYNLDLHRAAFALPTRYRRVVEQL
ncbi:MAG: polyamine aminopropyltransferase [Bradymonadaceae bacterium]|nr:polyamine aminopropyltransferase [Lujinxingiaceae bacterium]